MGFYYLSDTIDFGCYKGEIVSDVYQFDPQYIEWCLVNIQSFCIDVQALNNLPDPTPMKLIDFPNFLPNILEEESETMWINGLDIGNKVKSAKKYLSEGNILESQRFNFSHVARNKCISLSKSKLPFKSFKDIKTILESNLEKDLFNQSLLIIKEKENKFRLNGFTFYINELIRNYLERLAPQQDVKKCIWYNQKIEEDKPARWQIIRYAIHGGLTNELLSKKGIDVHQLIKKIKEIDSSLNFINNLLNINQSNFDLSESIVEKKFIDIFSGFTNFISTIESYRKYIMKRFSYYLNKAPISEALSNNFEYIDLFELDDQHSISSFELCEYYITEIRDKEVCVKSIGNFVGLTINNSLEENEYSKAKPVEQKYPFNISYYYDIETIFL